MSLGVFESFDDCSPTELKTLAYRHMYQYRDVYVWHVCSVMYDYNCIVKSS